MRNKIRLDTYKDAVEFNHIVSNLDGIITVTDGANHRVSGKSLLGMLYALEFNEVWVEAEYNIYSNIEKFVVV